MLIIKALESYRAEVINYFMVLQVMMKDRRSGHSALRVTNSQKEKRRKVGGEKVKEKKDFAARGGGGKGQGSKGFTHCRGLSNSSSMNN